MKIYINKNKERDSNIELLRIISIFFILLLHANFKSIHAPTTEDIHNEPIFSFFRIFMDFLCIVGVNVFILISGWYGIKPKFKRLLELIFQVLFFSGILYCLLFFNNRNSSSTIKELYSLVTLSNYWFVPCYILLYVLSPILNMFVKHASRNQLLYIVFFLFFLQIIYGWFPSNVNYLYYSGYSPIFFIFLYLIGRYISIYKPRFSLKSRELDILFYFVLSLLSSFLYFFSIKYSIFLSLNSILFYYTCPITILASIYLLFFFNKISFKSRLVNWIAISSFAAYLLQENGSFVDVYISNIQGWFIAESHMIFILYTTFLIVVIFIIAILMDKIRIAIWELLLNSLSKLIEKDIF